MNKSIIQSPYRTQTKHDVIFPFALYTFQSNKKEQNQKEQKVVIG